MIYRLPSYKCWKLGWDGDALSARVMFIWVAVMCDPSLQRSDLSRANLGKSFKDVHLLSNIIGVIKTIR